MDKTYAIRGIENRIISAGAHIGIPGSCIMFAKTYNLKIQQLTTEQISTRIKGLLTPGRCILIQREKA